MLFVLSLVARLLARLLVIAGTDEATKDLEILMLRDQLRVLQRTTGRPKFTPLDRILLAAASRALPRQRWTAVFRCDAADAAGTANWCDASGPTGRPASLVGRRSTLRSSRWCCA